MKLPRSWPNSSESMRPGGIAPQFTRRNGPEARRERAWIARATTSLPEPVSPSTSTGTSRPATSPTRSITGRRPEPAPTMVSPRSVRPSLESSAVRSASAASRTDDSARTRRSFSSAAAKGARSDSAIVSCAASKRRPRRATRSSTPRGSSGEGSGTASTSPSTPSGSRPGSLRRSTPAPACSSAPLRHQARSASRSSAPSSLRDGGAFSSASLGAVASVSTVRRARSSSRTESSASGSAAPSRGKIWSTACASSRCWQASLQISVSSGSVSDMTVAFDSGRAPETEYPQLICWTLDRPLL